MTNNKVLFALNFPGIALLHTQYTAFSKNIEIVSQGTFRCEAMGTCSAETTCDQVMSHLWSFDFKIRFSDSENYLRIPLASLAINDALQGSCVL